MHDDERKRGPTADAAGGAERPAVESNTARPAHPASDDRPGTTRSGGIELPMATPVPRRAGEAVGMGRREALKVIGLAAAAGATGLSTTGCEGPESGTGAGGAGQSALSGDLATRESAAFDGATVGGNPMARGWPWDPDLVTPTRPWDLVLTEDEREGLAVLVDLIIPADDVSPAASDVGAVDFIDEWVSAPMESMGRDLVLIRGGLAWLDREAATRFGDGRRFRDLAQAQQTAICDDICWRETTAEEHLYGSRFFDKVRDLTATAFYTTEEGMEDIGYVGNRPLPEWTAPPPEVLRHLGLPEAGA